MISLNRVVFSFKIYFYFSFCSDINLEAAVGKTDEIRDLKQLFTPFSLNWKKNISKIINNYRIAHQKNHVKITMTELSTNSGLMWVKQKYSWIADIWKANFQNCSALLLVLYCVFKSNLDEALFFSFYLFCFSQFENSFIIGHWSQKLVYVSIWVLTTAFMILISAVVILIVYFPGFVNVRTLQMFERFPIYHKLLILRATVSIWLSIERSLWTQKAYIITVNNR